VTPTADTKTPQARCEHTIRHLFTTAMAVFLRAHPDLLLEKTVQELADEMYPFQKLCDEVIDQVREFAIAERVSGE
jgi:hypothetical protein